MDLTIAVVSDLHIGNARSDSLNPDSYSNDEASQFIHRFRHFAENENINPDYLLVPGDISHKAKPQQVIVASNILSTLQDILDVSTSETFFVPGNHDVDWSYLKEDDPTGHYREQRFSVFKDRDTIFASINNNSTYSQYRCPYLSVWETSDLLLIGYNSSWDEGPFEPNPHHGLITNSHLEELDTLLSHRDSTDTRLRAFIVHHHPIVHGDITGKDFSTMQNGDKLIELLIKHGVDLLVHGHKHQPRFRHRSEGFGRCINILCAGSFCSSLSRWPRNVNNAFHTINIDSRDNSTGCITGRLFSWVYFSGHGWCKMSSPVSDISHVEPFGTYIQERRLLSIVKPIIKTQLESTDWLTWSDIAQVNNKLKHVPNKQREYVLKKVSDCLDIDFYCNDSDMIIVS